MTYKNPYHTVQTTRRVLFGIAWLPLALCLTGAPIECASAAQTATLAFAGIDAPDGNGTLLGVGGVLTLNAKGDVAFVCDFTNTQNPSTDSGGLCLVNTKSFKQLVRTGESAPDGNGTFNYFTQEFGSVQKLVLNDNGTVAFLAMLTGTAGGSTDEIGLFSASATTGVKQIVRSSDAAPDGNGIFARAKPDDFDSPGLSLPGLDNSGQISFHAFLTDTSGDSFFIDDTVGVFWSDGNTVTRLLRGGGAVPGGDEIFGRLDSGFASNPGGQVAISASIAFDFMSGDPLPDDLNRVYKHTGTVLEEVVRSGIPIPDGNGQLAGAGGNVIANNGNILFLGRVEGSDNYLLDGLRLFQTDGVTLTQIARQLQQAPGEPVEPGKPTFHFGNFTAQDISNYNKVAFSVILERNTIEDNRSSAIYRGDGNSITLLVHEDDTLPGGNGTFGNVAVALFLNNNGEIAFSAPLEGTSDPNDNSGIFFIGPDRSVQTVARYGMPLAGSTILWASFLGDLVSPGALDNSELALAGMNAINDSGQVAFSATLADGRIGVFLWQASDVPPPDDDIIYTDGFE